jgi:transcriptional regulator with XRE-family HTH domain
VAISIHQHFGQRVKELRNALPESQEAFADRCGIARSYVSRIERGRANPSLTVIAVFARALGVKPADLFSESARVGGKR